MSVFSANINHRSFTWQISGLCFVLGLLLAAAAHTATQINRSGVGLNRVGFSYGSTAQVPASKIQEDESEIKKLRDQNTALENRLAERRDASSTLNQMLQDTKAFAGLTDVVGPGVQVTLVDSQKHTLPPTDPASTDQIKLNSLIHDSDIANVVNELKAAGAEALSVNGQRVVGPTPVRCVGPVIYVNDVPTVPPYVISAIGDPDALYKGLNLPGGLLDQFRQFDPNMVRVEKKSRLRIPAFAGSTQMHFGRAVESSGKDSK
ncbi:MAG TPA: DUF881 domain-containing protein [Chthonomonadaceae bacterium]|nr:DUF881 domain-containing protein [Chthonomonadaceae bacterium]